ncbi:MAG: response regulator transcription factor [bacterium]|nr:response regulator transcription factor [bacterium]
MTDQRKVLLLEDDGNLGTVLQEHLQMQEFEVTLCADGEQGLTVWRQEQFDLCLVDVMMPKLDGFSFAEEVRKVDKEVPIIFLTARSMKEDKILGFKVGCDDYITKPFSVEELMLRIEAVLRRTGSTDTTNNADEIQIGSYRFVFSRQLLIRNDQEQKLTPKESELLRFLCLNRNRTILREEALREIWSDDSYFAGRSMDMFISRLRKYLKEDSSIEIMGVHGKGFRMVIDK